MFDKKAKLNAEQSFQAKHADLVARAEAKGIDWKALLEKFGPLILLILKTLGV